MDPRVMGAVLLLASGCSGPLVLEIQPGIVLMEGLTAGLDVRANPRGAIEPIEFTGELLDFETRYPGDWTLEFIQPNPQVPSARATVTLPSVDGPPLATLRITGKKGGSEDTIEGVLDLRSLGSWSGAIVAPEELRGGHNLDVALEVSGFNVEGSFNATLWFEVGAGLAGSAATTHRADVSIERVQGPLVRWTDTFATPQVAAPHDATLSLSLRFEPVEGRFAVPLQAQVKRTVRLVP